MISVDDWAHVGVADGLGTCVTSVRLVLGVAAAVAVRSDASTDDSNACAEAVITFCDRAYMQHILCSHLLCSPDTMCDKLGS